MVGFKGYFQQFSHPVVVLGTGEAIDTKSKAHVFGLDYIGAEDPIPKGKNIAIVPVGEGLPVVVMHPVHTRGNQYPPERPIQPAGQTDVRVVELGHQNRQGLVQIEQPYGRPSNPDGQQRACGPEYTFSWMMPVGGGGVDAGVTVVYKVKLPHPFYLMQHPVDEPSANEIQNHQPDYQVQPERYVDIVQQATLAAGCIATSLGDHVGE